MSLRLPAGPPFTPRQLPSDDLAGYVSSGTTTTAYEYRAVLVMHGSAEHVSDRIPPNIGVVEPIDAHTCRLRIGSTSLEQMAAWITAVGFDFDVDEPPELLAQLRAMAARAQRAAGGSR
jgi:hypothetical protein